MKQVFFAFPERDDFVFVPGGARLLQPVDFALDVGALPVVAQRISASGRNRRRRPGAPVCRGNLLDQRGFSCT